MRSSLAAFFLGACLAAPAAAKTDLAPHANEIFPLLIADPRHVRLSASYYRLDGRDVSDLALGHAWGLARRRTGESQDWLWESDLEAMAYSRFRVGGGVREFETADLLAALPVTVRRGDVSFKGSLFHENSVAGDGYVRRTGDAGGRFSVEGLRAQAALEPCRFARAYAGAEYLLRTVPTPKRWALQGGLELTAPELGPRGAWAATPFIAEDLQWRERVQWNPDSHLVAGLKFSRRDAPSRALRAAFGYYDGHSPYGRFYARRTHYADLSVSLEL